MKPCISQATTMPTSFLADVSAYAEGGCPAMEVWLTKLEKHLEGMSAASTKTTIADRGLTLAAAAYQGGILLSQGEQRKAHYDHFKRRLDLCQQFDIPTMLVVADFVQTVDATGLERAVVSLQQASQWADGFGVRLALEFRGRSTFCSSLDTAVQLIQAAGQPNLGICFDLFHYYTGPSKAEDIRYLTVENLFHVQLSDVAGVPREVATDGDRVLPGDGDFQTIDIVQHMKEIGYDGYVSLELMNQVLWDSKPRQVAEIGMASLRRALA